AYPARTAAGTTGAALSVGRAGHPGIGAVDALPRTLGSLIPPRRGIARLTIVRTVFALAEGVVSAVQLHPELRRAEGDGNGLDFLPVSGVQRAGEPLDDGVAVLDVRVRTAHHVVQIRTALHLDESGIGGDTSVEV